MISPVNDVRELSLITRGDDAGSSLSANRAILESCEEGILKNVSIMAPCPFLEDAYACLGHLHERVAFGFHACLNSEWDYPRWGSVLPPSQVVPLLENDGCFTKSPKVLQARKVSVDLMLSELRAQLDQIREVGFRPVYMDEHMGVGWIDGLGEALIEFAAVENLIFRPAVRNFELRLESDEVNAARFREVCESTESGVYLYVTHPALDDEEMRAIRSDSHTIGRVVAQRNQERLLLRDPEVVRFVADSERVRCIRYDEIVTLVECP